MYTVHAVENITGLQDGYQQPQAMARLVVRALLRERAIVCIRIMRLPAVCVVMIGVS